MKTVVLRGDDPDSHHRAVRVLRAGGLVAFPTDTVYGLGCIAFKPKAVEKIYVAKGRSAEKSLPVLLGNSRDLDLVASDVTELASRLARSFWPGPLTLVVGKRAGLPEAISTGNTIAVRQPNHPLAISLLRSTGPLAVTSANLTDHPSARTADDVLQQLDGRVDLILDGGTAPGGVPSTIVDCTQSELVLLRQGPISLEELKASLVG
jgi:L-threonylcarbamoyladenylate synthase